MNSYLCNKLAMKKIVSWMWHLQHVPSYEYCSHIIVYKCVILSRGWSHVRIENTHLKDRMELISCGTIFCISDNKRKWTKLPDYKIRNIKIKLKNVFKKIKIWSLQAFMYTNYFLLCDCDHRYGNIH